MHKMSTLVASLHLPSDEQECLEAIEGIDVAWTQLKVEHRISTWIIGMDANLSWCSPIEDVIGEKLHWCGHAQETNTTDANS